MMIKRTVNAIIQGVTLVFIHLILFIIFVILKIVTGTFQRQINSFTQFLEFEFYFSGGISGSLLNIIPGFV